MANVVLGVVVKVSLIIEMDVLIVVLIMLPDVVVMTLVEVLDVTSSLVVFCKVVKLALVVVSAKLYYTSNHMICLDFVWIAIQRPKIVWMDPN